MIEKADGKVFAVFKESLITFCYLSCPEYPADHVLDGPVLVRDVDVGKGLSLCRNREKGGLSIWLVLTLMENFLISTTQNLNSTACLIENTALIRMVKNMLTFEKQKNFPVSVKTMM